MSFDPSVFPQDEATGIVSTVDWDDAGAIAQLAYDLNTTDYVLTGFEFTYDESNLILNVSGGVARVSQQTVATADKTEDDGPPAKVLQFAAFVAQRGASGDMSLTDAAVNHVYIAVDQTTNDRVTFRVNTDATVPPEPSLKVGTVDTTVPAADAINYVNRLPEAQFNTVEVHEPPPS